MRFWLLTLIGAFLSSAWSADAAMLHLRIINAGKGGPIDDARISIRTSAGFELLRNDAGRDFRLAAGTYEVTAQARGWNSKTVFLSIGPRDTWTTLALDLLAPFDCFSPAGAQPAQPRQPSLRILDAGSPAKGVWIKVVSVLASEVREAVTGQDGRIVLEALPNGPYLIVRESLPVVTRSISHDSYCSSDVELDFADRKQAGAKADGR